MTKKQRDIIYVLFFMALSIAGIVYSELSIDQNVVQYELARPDRYVQIWLGILFVLSVLLLIRTLRRNEQEKAPKILYASVIVTSLSFLAYLIVMPFIGYTISSFLFLFWLTLYFNLKETADKPKQTKRARIMMITRALIYSFVLSILTGLLFRSVLGVRLPDFFNI